MFAHTHRHKQSVHLLFVNQLRRIHKVLAIKQDDGGCDGAGGPPEGHVGQGFRPRLTCKDEHLLLDVVEADSHEWIINIEVNKAGQAPKTLKMPKVQKTFVA